MKSRLFLIGLTLGQGAFVQAQALHLRCWQSLDSYGAYRYDQIAGMPPEVVSAAALLPHRSEEALSRMRTYLRRNPKSLEGIKVYLDSAFISRKLLEAPAFLKSIGQTSKGKAEQTYGFAVLASYTFKQPELNQALHSRFQELIDASQSVMRYQTSSIAVRVWRFSYPLSFHLYGARLYAKHYRDLYGDDPRMRALAAVAWYNEPLPGSILRNGKWVPEPTPVTERSDLARSEAEARAALRLDPRLPLGHYALGIVLSRQNQVEPAKRAFRAFLTYSPRSDPRRPLVERYLRATKPTANLTIPTTADLRANGQIPGVM